MCNECVIDIQPMEQTQSKWTALKPILSLWKPRLSIEIDRVCLLLLRLRLRLRQRPDELSQKICLSSASTLTVSL
jgi:hypothetical protein